MLCCTNLTCPSVIGCSRNQTLGYWGNLNAAILVLFCKNFYTTIIPVLILIVFFLKVAAAPLAVKKMEQKRVVNPLFEKRAKNFGIGQVSNQSTFNCYATSSSKSVQLNTIVSTVIKRRVLLAQAIPVVEERNCLNVLKSKNKKNCQEQCCGIWIRIQDFNKYFFV